MSSPFFLAPAAEAPGRAVDATPVPEKEEPYSLKQRSKLLDIWWKIFQ
jgi:hypothetical protein